MAQSLQIEFLLGLVAILFSNGHTLIMAWRPEALGRVRAVLTLLLDPVGVPL
jgi:hypothetical protein